MTNETGVRYVFTKDGTTPLFAVNIRVGYPWQTDDAHKTLKERKMPSGMYEMQLTEKDVAMFGPGELRVRGVDPDTRRMAVPHVRTFTAKDLRDVGVLLNPEIPDDAEGEHLGILNENIDEHQAFVTVHLSFGWRRT